MGIGWDVPRTNRKTLLPESRLRRAEGGRRSFHLAGLGLHVFVKGNLEIEQFVPVGVA